MRLVRLTAAACLLLAVVNSARPSHAFAQPPGPQGRYTLGLIRNPHARVDLAAVPHRLAAAPAAADLRPWAPDPRNQGQFGSCASNATTELLAWQDNRYLAGAPAHGYAPMFQYEQLVGPQGCNPETGTSFDGNLNIEEQQGAVPADQYETSAGAGFNYGMYDCQHPPTAHDFALAAQRKITGWQYVSDTAGQQNEAILKNLIASGTPVLLGTFVYENFMFAGSQYPRVIGTPVGSELGAHAILALAYDATGPIFLNSWGDQWDMSGYGQMTWAAFDVLVFAMVTVDPPAQRPVPTQTPFPTDTPTVAPTATPRNTPTAVPTQTAVPTVTHTATPRPTPQRRRVWLFHDHSGHVTWAWSPAHA